MNCWDVVVGTTSVWGSEPAGFVTSAGTVEVVVVVVVVVELEVVVVEVELDVDVDVEVEEVG